MAFGFIDGDGAVNNTVTLGDFATDGALGLATVTGGVAGSLPGAVVLDDTGFFSELLQGIDLGTRISFTLDYTESFAGGFPDQFAFFLLDNDAITPFLPLFGTTDPTGAGALFAIDLDGNPGGVPSVYAGNPDDTRPQATWSVAPAQVPEPMTLWLWGAGLWGWRLTKRR
jgi:hypothetical protein